jgi:lysozyme family protein
MLAQEFEKWLGEATRLPFLPFLSSPSSPDRFSICLPYTLKEECPDSIDWRDPKNFSDDAHDPGGETWAGITNREYAVWLKAHALPVQDVRNITQAQGFQIYHDSYWMPDCPKLTAGLDLEFFDTSVNEGPVEAIKILQFSLGITADGTWGPQTEAAIGAITDRAAIVNKFTARREAVYRMTKGFQYFGKDWIGRAQRIGAAAAAMAA